MRLPKYERHPRLIYKEELMRRLQKIIEGALVDPMERYIDTRIEQLQTDMAKAHDEHDQNWYNRLIQELYWVKQMKTKPTHNCYMEADKS
tara:strand:- start:250 stop:519 length:270 start_codon:yes stop_codon:yes gene_type:complete